ncbi:LysR family transcriptional regulator [Curtobacterium sp. USHLN213]|uniref:LysR family transcriptional regulator n=1 Tax=Curtobacterium sp. USHLN213 TaxID=3081255 RepID=UPI0030176343
MLDARRLQLLADLERLGTIAAVASELRQTASGVSMQLSALEREAGVPLTERQGRRLRLTAAGTQLARHGRDLAAVLTLAELELDSIRAGSLGKYRIAAFPTAARTIVAPLSRHLRDAGGALDVELDVLEPDDAVEALRAGRIDAAIVHSYSNLPRTAPDGIHLEQLGSEPVVLAVPDTEPADTAHPLRNRSHEQWMAAPDGTACQRMLLQACATAGFEPAIAVRTIDYSVQLALVAAGTGVALVPRMAVTEAPAGVTFRTPDPAVRREVAVAIRQSSLSDAGLRALVDTIAMLATRVLEHPAVA